MRIYILLAHPNLDTLNGSFADIYEKTAKTYGHEVRRHNLGEMKFDPILWKGYKKRMELEPDLKQAQENIQWCEKWVIFYPIWWGSVPALLKGFLDRTLYSGFAYKYHENDPFWDKLLSGRSAQLITTCDAPSWWIAFMYRNSDLNMLKRACLEFCGVHPISVKRFSRIRYQSPEKVQSLIDSIPKLVPKLKNNF
jgi:NAD(P)H dehydrogenase (quinone)